MIGLQKTEEYFMKNLTLMFSVISLLIISLFSTTTFASMLLTSYPAGLASGFYSGTIKSVTYVGTNNQTVVVNVDTAGGNYPNVGPLTITFAGEDFAFGSALSSAVSRNYSLNVTNDYSVNVFNINAKWCSSHSWWC